MKKILLLLLLFAPLYVSGQTWFTADAVRFDIDEEWEKCDIQVSIDNDWKLNIYAETHHTIRKIKNLGGGEDEDGNIHNMWRGVDQDGNECNLLLTVFKHIPYLRLTISFEFIDIYYMLTQND